MQKLFLIAFSNIKKKKGAMAIITLLITFATMLLYISISTLTMLGANSEKSYDFSNLADVEYIMPEAFSEDIDAILAKKDGITRLEKTSSIFLQSAKYKREMSDEDLEMGILIQDVQTLDEISRITCDIDLETFPDNGIILNQYMSSTGTFRIGDPYLLTIGNNTYTFEVVGFSEDGIFASPMNLSVQRLFMKADYFKKILEDSKDFMPLYYDYKLKLKEGLHGDEFEKNLLKEISTAIPDVTNHGFCSLSWENLKPGIMIVPSIAMAIVLVFAILLMIIAISIIYYNIRNFMDENLPNIGILKASGYTSRELRLSLLLEILMVSLIGIVVGLILGILLAPVLGNLLSAVMGILWRIGFVPVAAVAASVIVLAMILGITLFLGRRYKTIFVLDALRGGVTTHHFKRNFFPLETSGLPLLGSLGCKEIFHEKRKNICVAIIITFLTFASCAGIYIYTAFGANPDNLILLSGVELSDVMVSTPETRYGEFDPTSLEGVENVYYHNNMDLTLECNGKSSSVDCDLWDIPSKIQNEMMIEGRLPEKNNEIVISKLIKDELDAKVGDIVFVSENGTTYDYMIVGIDQKINHYGRKAMMTFEAVNRFKPEVVPAGVYINLQDGYTFSSVRDTIQEAFPNGSLAEGEQFVSSFTAGIQSIMFLICLLFLLMTLLIVFLVLIMIGKSRIIQKRQELGIRKAIGFTTGQLMVQNIISTIPVVFTGGLIGMFTSFFLINPLVSLCLYSFGVGSCDFGLQPLLYFLVVIGITVESLLVTLITSGKIRKIEPIRMIRES